MNILKVGSVTAVSLALSLNSFVQAGDREWAVAGKVLTGIVAAGIIADAVAPRTYAAPAPVVYAPAPVTYAPAPVVYSPPPPTVVYATPPPTVVYAPRVAYLPPAPVYYAPPQVVYSASPQWVTYGYGPSVRFGFHHHRHCR